MNARAQIALVPREVRFQFFVLFRFSHQCLSRHRSGFTACREYSGPNCFETLLNQLLEYAEVHAEDRKLWDSIMSFHSDLCQVQTAAWKELWRRRAERSETASTALFRVVRSVLEKLDAGTPTPEDIVSALLFAPFRLFSID